MPKTKKISIIKNIESRFKSCVYYKLFLKIQYFKLQSEISTIKYKSRFFTN